VYSFLKTSCTLAHYSEVSFKLIHIKDEILINRVYKKKFFMVISMINPLKHVILVLIHL